jgi:hypothetical protein
MKKSIIISLLFVLALALSACTQAAPAPTALPTEDLPTSPSSPVETAPVETTAPGPDLESFVVTLVQTLNAKDFEQMETLMGDSFTFGFWLGEGVTYSRQEAIEQLRTNYLGPETAVVVDRDADLAAILGGTDPSTIAGPVNIAEAFFVDGLGFTGGDEGIVFIAQRDDGSYYWHSILIAGGGFSSQGNLGEGVVETSVQFVRPAENVNIYSLPDLNSAVIGGVAGGQTALVTGASSDGLWWRVVCPDDTIGSCWVPAAQAPPTEAP